ITIAVGDSPELNHQLGDRPRARFPASGHGKIVAFPNYLDKAAPAKQLSYATIFGRVALIPLSRPAARLSRMDTRKS
ncbi:MAG: hypothetical protein ACE10G_12320, partial [Gemmatimonadales bacterium]